MSDKNTFSTHCTHQYIPGKFAHTFTVITEAHLGLAKTNGVLALTNAIELFELSLVNTLWRG